MREYRGRWGTITDWGLMGDGRNGQLNLQQKFDYSKSAQRWRSGILVSIYQNEGCIHNCANHWAIGLKSYKENFGGREQRLRVFYFQQPTRQTTIEIIFLIETTYGKVEVRRNNFGFLLI